MFKPQSEYYYTIIRSKNKFGAVEQDRQLERKITYSSIYYTKRSPKLTIVNRSTRHSKYKSEVSHKHNTLKYEV